ncbi:hypothetical protein MZO42_08165 [Sphingomonas psychrotolerans]|uniref:Uncharacterized protein n=1 Tax=Sphingomonas psychrotolerans TaxID=1327635 RepID=A0ABU3N294_9SPHN|nr:hypothetical protein [Sphingomonas psychrotolerans]MDT8758670.1 hypothetical protein [Sphingomonas psychrotolerans]
MSVLFLLLAGGFLFWQARVGHLVIGDTHRRNFHALEVAANGLEYWPTALRGVAIANFVPDESGHVPEASATRQSEGWQWARRLRHPTFDQYELLFRIGKRGSCRSFRDAVEERERMRLPFIASNRSGEGPQLKIVDSVPIEDLWVRNHVATAEPPAGRVTIPGVEGAWALDDDLCYGAVVPIEPLLGTARAFSTLLVVDADRNVVQQVGRTRIPVDTLNGLVPSSSILSETFASMVAGKAVKVEDPKPLADKLEPVSLRIADVDYRAYVRLFRLPPGVQGCEPRSVEAVRETTRENTNGTSRQTVKETIKAASEANAEAPVAAPASCLLVGLVPEAQILQTALRPSALVRALLLLSVGVLIAGLPAMRLLLSGPADGIAAFNAKLIIPSTLILASLLTYAALFGFDLIRAREKANAVVFETASSIATTTAAEIRRTVRAAEDIVASRADDLLPSPDKIRNEPSPDTIALESTPLGAENAARWPNIASVVALGPLGRPIGCGTSQVALRSTEVYPYDVSGRRYFKRLLAGDVDNGPGIVLPRLLSAPLETLPIGIFLALPSYTIDEVRTQTEGISQLILALDAASTLQPSRVRSGPCEARAFLATAVLSELAAPVLPQGMEFLVVDAGDPVLPVLFHRDPDRAGVENFAAQLDDPGRRKLQQWINARPVAGSLTFEARYDGTGRHFVAVPVQGSSWVVLVSYSIDRVAGAAASRLNMSLLTGAMPLFPLFVGYALFAFGAPRMFRNLWPHERPAGRGMRLFRSSGMVLVMLFAGELLAVASGATPWALLAALLLALVAILFVIVRNYRPGDVGHPLTPITERRFQWTMFCLILAVAVGPSIAVWSECRPATASAGVAERRALRDQRAAVTKLIGVLRPGETDTDLEQGMRVVYRAGEPAPARSGVIAAQVRDWIGKPPPVEPVAAAPDDPALAVRNLPAAAGGGLPGLILRVGLACLVALAAASIWLLLRMLLVAVAGFGVPLEAVRRPKLDLRDSGPRVADAMRPGPRALVVGAPHSVLAWLKARSWIVVDLNSGTPVKGDLLSSDKVVVINLHLVLRDGERRRGALMLLEALHEQITAAGKLIVLSNLAPLERILDAYERDQRNPEERLTVSRYREQLRWATLFENFNTFTFAAKEPRIRLRLLDTIWRRQSGWRRRQAATAPVTRRARGVPDDRRDAYRAVAAVLQELAWLPAELIATTIGMDDLDQRLAALVKRELARKRPEADPPGIFPIGEHLYRRLLSRAALQWARRLRAPSVAAVEDHLRGMLIEHYQKAWSASSYAERVLLDHLARGRMVNIRSAHIPLASLVRRGLVVFGPSPGLMNQSFRRFVLQAERPDRIRWWRTLQPVSAWARARWPLLIGIPLVAMLVGIAIRGGDRNLASLLPLIAAGGAPVIVAAFWRGVRAQFGPAA